MFECCKPAAALASAANRRSWSGEANWLARIIFNATVRPLELISVWPSGAASRPPSTGPMEGYEVVVPRATDVIDNVAELAA